MLQSAADDSLIGAWGCRYLGGDAMTNGQDRRVVAIIYSVMAREAGSMASSETALRHFAALRDVPPQSLSALLGPTPARLSVSSGSASRFLPPPGFFDPASPRPGRRARARAATLWNLGGTQRKRPHATPCILHT